LKPPPFPTTKSPHREKVSEFMRALLGYIRRSSGVPREGSRNNVGKIQKGSKLEYTVVADRYGDERRFDNTMNIFSQ
jgi:hypothetical protein